MPMPSYQSRVINEKRYLDDKLERLNRFLQKPAEGVEPAELERMSRQATLMDQYSQVLQERIDCFPKG